MISIEKRIRESIANLKSGLDIPEDIFEDKDVIDTVSAFGVHSSNCGNGEQEEVIVSSMIQPHEDSIEHRIQYLVPKIITFPSDFCLITKDEEVIRVPLEEDEVFAFDNYDVHFILPKDVKVPDYVFEEGNGIRKWGETYGVLSHTPLYVFAGYLTTHMIDEYNIYNT